MFYIKTAIAIVLAYADWKILSHLYVKWKISKDEFKALFIGTCILLAAFVIGGN